MMDAITQERIALVHPSLASIVTQMDTALELQGIVFRCVQGLRTIADQAALYAQGRTAPGPIVTRAQPGYSAHNFGYAVDLIPGLRGQDSWTPNWDQNSADFRAMITCGIGLGLVSGSTWVDFKDYPHFQLAGLPVTPTQAMRDCLTNEGLAEFWNEFIY